MNTQITAIYAAILAFILMGLSTAVIVQRVKTGTSLLEGGHKSLAEAIRRHGNFIEYIPMAILLMAFAENLSAYAWLLHAAGISLIAGRLMHAAGLQMDNASNPLRIAGMMATFIPIVVLATTIVWFGVFIA